MAKADSVTHTFEPIFNNESKVFDLRNISVGKIQRTAVLLRASAEPFLETVSIADGG